MRTQSLSTLFTLTLVTLFALPLAAQEEPQAEFRGELQVTEVLLDVLVTDGSGNAILGLKPEDFIVEDEGEKVDRCSGSRRHATGPADPAALDESRAGARVPECRRGTRGHPARAAHPQTGARRFAARP